MPDLTPKPRDAGKKKKQQRDLADPKLRDKHANDPSWGYAKAGQDDKNSLFYYGVKVTDVYQGAVADCYFVAALAAVASKSPDLIKNGIIDNGDGTYRVRFFQKKDYWSSNYDETWVTVDGDLPALNGNLRYAKGQSTRKGGRELWPGIYEKAYAELKGGYNEMGEGGSTAAALEALTGSRTTYKSTEYTPADHMWDKIKKATDGGNPVAAGTHGKDRDDLYKGTRLYAWHAYTVMGAYEKGRGKNRKRYVKIRNPWGRVEPGQDGKDDGIFELTIEDFMKFYSSVNFSNLNK